MNTNEPGLRPVGARSRLRQVAAKPVDERDANFEPAALAEGLTVKPVGERLHCRREPCSDCPWRVDAPKLFPAAAFERLANTAYDMSLRMFTCHQSAVAKPVVCAGFLLRGAAHNLAVRLAYAKGRIGDDIHDGGHPLHDCYRDMAIANGMDADASALQRCRDDK